MRDVGPWWILVLDMSIAAFNLNTRGYQMGSESLWQKFRRLLSKPAEFLLKLQARNREKGEQLRRYACPLFLFYFLNVLIYYYLLYHQLIPSDFLPYFVLTFFVIQLGLGVSGTVVFLRVTGKWGYLLLATFVLIAIIAVLVYHFSRI